MSAWETVIGLEVHAQLRTRTKIFCGCSTEFGATPNTQICPVCTGQPGALPVLNRAAVRLAVRVSRALGCQVRRRSHFARKNYFYPDLPKGYQISQLDRPVAEAGSLTFPLDGRPRTVRINRVHMEEDAGKSVHVAERPVSWVDFNRAGVPLVEMVSEPDLRSPEEASAYLKELRAIVRMTGVSDGNMEEGSFRCDANISLRRPGAGEYGARVEIKNMNSFKHVRLALRAEQARQADVLEGGGVVAQETRLWDEARGRTQAMRSKEDAQDYRYFPDPDLPTLEVEEAWMAEPLVLPADVRAEVLGDGLRPQAAEELAADPVRWTQYVAFKAAWGAERAGKHALSGAVPRDAEVGFAVQAVGLLVDGAVNAQALKRVFAEAGGGESPAEIVARLGLEQVRDEGAVAAQVRRIVEAHPAEAQRYREGDPKVFGFFMGQAMRALKGKGDPGQVKQFMEEMLRADD